jgi:hypothetical protein
MIKEMEQTANHISYYIGLYIRGEMLDPTLVSRVLDKEPDYLHKTGDKFPLRSGGFGTRNISIWSLSIKGEKKDINDAINHFCELHLEKFELFSNSGGSILNIEGVDEAYVDILVLAPDNKKSIFFNIGQKEIQILAKFGVSIDFNVKVD